MTNNLKILTILSIFVLILTGYFYFSSSFTKNQIIANNNEEKDNKDPDINNEDSNNNEEKASKLLILNIIILVIILIIIVGVIIFIIVNFNKSKFEIKKEEFKIKENSKEDFKKENFCPLFFLIRPSLVKGIVKKVEENEECFFKILAICNSENSINNIDKVVIFLGTTNDNDNKLANNVFTITLNDILNEIAEFAAFTINVEEKDIDEITESSKIEEKDLQTTSKLIKKYGHKFDSYLCSYLLYYLAAEIAKKKINVEINNPKDITYAIKSTKFTFDNNRKEILKDYFIYYDIMDKILEKLLNDKPLKNVEYIQDQQEIL